jgi:DNA invertase Pin-like site-specific DNA recombinase
MSTTDVETLPVGQHKTTSRHRERLAIVYVRQSSIHQMQRHKESTQLQYGLVDHAVRLGWPRDRVQVFDEDQGRSGASAEARSGFQRLLAEVALGHVGLILGVEMSRLARSCKDWYQLLELCALFGTLIYDLDGLYDPTLYNDRLLLGLKGTMSEAELHILRQRMLQGAKQKARRGELLSRLPIGYLRDIVGHIGMDPDEQMRAVVMRVFESFERIGTVAGTLRRLRNEGVQIGIRIEGGPDRGTLQWRRPNMSTIRSMLSNPMYAGAYAYGRRGRQTRPNGHSWWRQLPTQQWQVLIQDHFPAYISWAQYEANMRQMSENRSRIESRCAVRRGSALLTGLAVCGYCGYRMRTHYGKAKQPTYNCEGKKVAYAEPMCQSLSAPVLDQEVVRQVLLALEPSALEVSLQVALDLKNQRVKEETLWRQRIERASYEVDRARRQYEAVEPENRLVARTLESNWETALRQQRQLTEEHERWRRECPRLLSEGEQEQIKRLAADLPTLWQAPSTQDEDRKAILRLIIERVVVQVEGRTEWVEAWIHWVGGQRSYMRVRRPVLRHEQLANCNAIDQMILTLHQQGVKSLIVADNLNTAGHRSPHGVPFTAESVRKWLSRYRPTPQHRPAPPLKEHEWAVADLARYLNVSDTTVRSWVRRGELKARYTDESARRLVVHVDENQLENLVKRLKNIASRTSTNKPSTIDLRGQ